MVKRRDREWIERKQEARDVEDVSQKVIQQVYSLLLLLRFLPQICSTSPNVLEMEITSFSSKCSMTIRLCMFNSKRKTPGDRKFKDIDMLGHSGI